MLSERDSILVGMEFEGGRANKDSERMLPIPAFPLSND
jgi:hypothetical protein